MAVRSMTGFARVDGAQGSTAWSIEAKSVNGKGLDVRLRLPPGLDSLEAPMRAAVTKVMARGTVNIAINVTKAQRATRLVLNEAVLADVLIAIERVRNLVDAQPPRSDGVLGLKGVLEAVEPEEDPAHVGLLQGALLSSLEEALAGLNIARDAEGARLSAVLGASLDEVERLLNVVATSPARHPEAIAARLTSLAQRLVTASPALDPIRLHQEAVLLATKADVEEELKRLEAHVAAARDLLGANDGPMGRKFDFLTQEFNREANTLCSKSQDIEISRAGLALKVVVDQMREQVQNIE